MSIRALIEVNCDRFMLPAIDRKLVSTATHDVVARDRLRQSGVRFMGERHYKDTGLIAEDEWRNMNDLDAITAKDAEIERLRSALEAIATADQPRWNALRLQMVACEALETHERADVPRQDRRYRALRHQTPASPTGDTRG